MSNHHPTTFEMFQRSNIPSKIISIDLKICYPSWKQLIFFLFSFYLSTLFTCAAPVESNNTAVAPYRTTPCSTDGFTGRTAATHRLSRRNSQSTYSGGANNNGNSTPTQANLAHSAETASFTVRREMERHRGEMEQIQQLRQVIAPC